MVLLTSGSRGDVEPFTYLGSALLRRGHSVLLVTHERFREFANERGIPFAPLNDGLLELGDRTGGGGRGNPLALMREAREIISQTLQEAWAAVQEADLIVHHPKALAGPTLAEALGAQAVLCLFVPMLVPTGEFSHPLLGGRDLGPLNRATFAVDRLIVAPYRGTLNRWREERGLPTLPGLPRLDRLGNGQLTPVLFPFSPTLVPRPRDWPERVKQTGFWFPPEEDDASELPPDLERFLERGPAPLFAGFGSMQAPGAGERTRMFISAAQRLGVRLVIATGWGGLERVDNGTGNDQVFFMEGAPYQKLFPRVAAVVHHGGAGTTAAGLRAGRPTLICPFFGDQPFWGARVAAVGAGPAPLPAKRLNAESLERALEELLSPETEAKAQEVGDRVRAENGTEEAAHFLEELLYGDGTQHRVTHPVL